MLRKVKKPRPARRGFYKPKGSLSPIRYELPFIPALPSGASWQILVTSETWVELFEIQDLIEQIY